MCFIRYDDSSDDDYLMLIYLEDSNPSKENIVVEDKTNEEKHVTKTFKTSAIFSYSDYLVDQFTAHLDREFKKKKSQDKVIKIRSKNQTSISNGFVIDFWQILGPFWGPKSIKNRCRNRYVSQAL